ncbi:Cu-binding protein [Thelotrema lepadinum]|nr:Cu-binding protein [Thelotrema lepadinum]
MSLRQSALRFQCLYTTARQRIANLQQRSSSHGHADLSYSTASYAPLRSTLRSTKASSVASIAPSRPVNPFRTRPFSTSKPSYDKPKTVQQARSRYVVGPISFLSVSLFIGAGIGLYFYFDYEKARMERKRVAEAAKGVGKPKVGGKFELVDQNWKPWGSERMRGRFALVYFGFTHCPDICPEELDKMASMLDLVAEKLPPSAPNTPNLLPVFITCDPARDTPSVMKTYLREFHEDIIGLTGTWEQIKAVCRLYRVYFSTPQGVKPGDDYLVDHSIYFYLMDPEGDFVEAIGRQHSAEQAAKIITQHMEDWKGSIVKG